MYIDKHTCAYIHRLKMHVYKHIHVHTYTSVYIFLKIANHTYVCDRNFYAIIIKPTTLGFCYDTSCLDLKRLEFNCCCQMLSSMLANVWIS